MRSLRTRIKNIEKNAAAEADKSLYVVFIHDDIYSFTTYNGEDFTLTKAEYNAYKATHNIDDSKSIMLYTMMEYCL